MNHAKARAALLTLRTELAARHQRIDKHIGHRDEPLPSGRNDRAVELGNRETLEQLDEGAQIELAQIDHALDRIEAGSYGRCERCHRSIPRARLELLPYATRCVLCAEPA